MPHPIIPLVCRCGDCLEQKVEEALWGPDNLLQLPVSMLIRLFSHQTTGSHTLTRTRTSFVQWKTRNLLSFLLVCFLYFFSQVTQCLLLFSRLSLHSIFLSFILSASIHHLPSYSHCYLLSLMFISCFNVSSSCYICIIFFLLLYSFFLYFSSSRCTCAPRDLTSLSPIC